MSSIEDIKNTLKKILKLVWQSAAKHTALHRRSAQAETLFLFVLSVVANFVFFQKLCMFLPQDFCLLLEAVDPKKQHGTQTQRHL